MKIITSAEEGARHLLAFREEMCPEFSIINKREGEFTDTLELGNQKIPLLYWRFDPRIKAIYDYADEDVSSLSSLNVYSFVGSDMSLDELIARELDIAEFILHSKIKRITAFISGASCNLIAAMENGTLANLELGATMARYSINQCQHRLVTSRGMACDRVVDTQTTLAMLNVYTASGEHLEIDPGDIDLPGLDFTESFKAYCIRGAVLGISETRDFAEAQFSLSRLVAAARKSADTCAPVLVSEVM